MFARWLRWWIYLGRTLKGSKHRVNAGISCDPDILDKVDKRRGHLPRSTLVELLFEAYLADPSIIKLEAAQA